MKFKLNNLVVIEEKAIHFPNSLKYWDIQICKVYQIDDIKNSGGGVNGTDPLLRFKGITGYFYEGFFRFATPSEARRAKYFGEELERLISEPEVPINDRLKS